MPASSRSSLACAAALATVLAAARPAAAQHAPPPAGAPGEPPCVPVKPCEIPDEPAPAAEPPAELGAEVRRLFDLVACRGPAPAGLDAQVVGAFCAEQRRALEAFRTGPRAKALEALAPLRPAGLPSTAVVPGGADLLTALGAFPDLKNVTTFSAAPAGDPRVLAGLAPERLRQGLAAVRAGAQALLRGEGATARGASRPGEFPVQLALFLTALAAEGYEPTGLRYFTVQPDGTLRHLGRADLGAGRAPLASSELTFVRRGDDPRTRTRTHRHVAADLSDAALARSPGVLAHLAGKGELSVALGAAGASPWRDDHARVRKLLLERAAMIVSAGPRLPAALARQAGLSAEERGPFQVARRDRR
ncbi:conserved hypothetical protein [Anaeromyxobacter dehalogenans 2CP-1]|uniref:Uncharacterized protein n=1 Tax=Anaeromyxobacter dehalogenans (strain ATCC BAA-258 / DSM 21875 / 2CP-1) TaxID=455488 RepID=B8J925_ANAD2|nr:hypothetical protein [Anaeromyxobacter dehalogenans]ACL63623.1 conserved hypothetical protein [Anaeromyxobacter dehalogenans 2CP-1]